MSSAPLSYRAPLGEKSWTELGAGPQFLPLLRPSLQWPSPRSPQTDIQDSANRVDIFFEYTYVFLHCFYVAAFSARGIRGLERNRIVAQEYKRKELMFSV